MSTNPLVHEIHSLHNFFKRSVSIFTEADSRFAPSPEMYPVAGQIAHTAFTIDWFLDAAFVRTDGFDMQFDEHIRLAMEASSLTAELARFDKACARATELIGGAPMDFMMQPIPNDQIAPGAPRLWIVGAMTDHTAHHRGALTVYARLLGKVSPMPYM